MDPDDSKNRELFSMLAFLYLAYDKKGQLYNKTTPNPGQALFLQSIEDALLKGYREKYFAQRPIGLSSAGQMEQYLAIKQSEIVFLKRQQSKMERIEHHYDKQFVISLNEWTKARQAFGQENSMEEQQSCRIAQHQRKVVRHVRAALPGIISKARETHRELKSRLVQVRQQEEETQRVERLRSEREEMEKEVHTLAAWTTSVVPYSTAYRELWERWKVAWEKKKSAEAAYESQILGGHAVGGTSSSEL